MKILDPQPGAGSPHSPSIAAKMASATQRRRWQRHAEGWEDHAVHGLESVIEAVLARADRPSIRLAVDVGCGGGALALPLADRAEAVIAVDVSKAMLEKLRDRAAKSGVDNIDLRCEPIEVFDLPAGSVDLVVSNYALHHLLDRHKRQFVAKAYTWLRPGGELVIGDMMIGRGLKEEDRRILAGKARALAARGPGGWWRIAKNAWRLYSRTVERPVPTERWVELLSRAGFADVTTQRVVSEAAVVAGRRP